MDFYDNLKIEHNPLFNYFKRILNNGSGDCLFYTISQALLNKADITEDEMMYTRKEIYNYKYRIENDDYPPSSKIVDGIDIGFLSTMIKLSKEEEKHWSDFYGEKVTMKDKKIWGTEYEIFKASKRFKIPIVVYNNFPSNSYENGCLNYERSFKITQDFPKLKVHLMFPHLIPYLKCIYVPNKNYKKHPIVILSTGNHYELLMPI